MAAQDPDVRRALSLRAIQARWGNTDASDDAARQARTMLLERDLRKAVEGPPALTLAQRRHLVEVLLGGSDAA